MSVLLTRPPRRDRLYLKTLWNDVWFLQTKFFPFSAFICVLLRAIPLFSIVDATLAANPTPLYSRTNLWTFQPMSHPTPPAVARTTWVRNDLDRFILSRLEKEHLEPSPEATRRVLIRRLSFDLIGLPPTPDDIEAFLTDKSPDAYDALVDRLLASPHYGERWARHWLDVVHYGESHGYDKDKPRLNAWPYRDYVIDAFNHDKSYSRFVQEQIAGDILFPDDPEGVVALGFISAGPWDFVGHVELPESKTDGLIARYNDRDDMVMSTMSTFLSLTVHCARCHDHKFDPIGSREYYSLQAVFAGVDRAERPFDADPKVFKERKDLLSRKKRLTSRQREIDAEVASTTNPEIAAADSSIKNAKAELANLPAAEESPSNGYHSDIESQQDKAKWVQVDLASPQAIDEIRLIPARPTDFPDTPGFGFPLRFRVETSDDDTFSEPRLIADNTGSDYPNPSDVPVVFKALELRARYIRITATKLWERTKDYVFALAELEVMRGTNNLAHIAPVQALDSIESGRWGKSKLVDGFDSRKRIDATGQQPEIAAKRRDLQNQLQSLTDKRRDLIAAALPHALIEERKSVSNQLAELSGKLDSLPKPQWAYAAASDFAANGNFTPHEAPRKVNFLKRGSVTSPAEEMMPGALACLPGLDKEFDLSVGANEGERRAALGRWLTDPKNDLMRRSIVNRVWQYHFGRGLVDTPNDFGHLGSLPSHPELLDWLAGWFESHGESLKALHKLIVTSAIYRQASDPNPLAEKIDADNRLLWRMSRTRLDAESLRDAILSVSGLLNPAMGGPSVQQFWFKDDHSPTYDYTRFDVDSPGALRRSVYRFIVRSVPDPFMETMDCPDPSVLAAKRNTTLTPLQALSLLNNPFVLRQAEHFAERISRQAPTLRERVDLAYKLAVGRAPSEAETALITNYAQRYGLANACRVLLNSNEFVFVD
jgi:hypothetical protein